MSPLSSSVALACQLTGCGPIENMKTLMRTNIPCFILTLIFYGYIGFSAQSTGSSSVDTSALLNALTEEFTYQHTDTAPSCFTHSPHTFKFPIIPTFIIGVLSGAAEALLLQNYPIEKRSHRSSVRICLCRRSHGQPTLSYGGIDSMTSIVALLMFAAAFGGIIKKLGVIDCLLSRILWKFRQCFSHHYVFRHSTRHLFVVTGNYFATSSILAPSLNEIYDRQKLPRENISAILLDTGTGLSSSRSLERHQPYLYQALSDMLRWTTVCSRRSYGLPYSCTRRWSYRMEKTTLPGCFRRQRQKKAGKAFVIRKFYVTEKRPALYRSAGCSAIPHRWGEAETVATVASAGSMTARKYRSSSSGVSPPSSSNPPQYHFYKTAGNVIDKKIPGDLRIGFLLPAKDSICKLILD